MRKLSKEPFTLAEVQAIIEVFEVLHGHEDARIKIRDWSAPKTFTAAAYEYVVAYIDDKTRGT